jgi:hypothetical protein
MITGRTDNSRLGELKKYAVGVPFSQQYVGGGSWTTDGVDYGNSPTIEYVVYYLGGIKYVDETLIDGTHTIFSYNPNNTENFIDEQYIKNPNKSKIVSNPKIFDDVFIVRDNLSAFEKNYRLEYIRNMIDLTTYAGGKYFNIINNI